MTFRSEFGIHEVPQRPEPLQAATPQGETFRQMQPDPKHSSSAEIRMAYQLFQSHSLGKCSSTKLWVQKMVGTAPLLVKMATFHVLKGLLKTSDTPSG